MPMSLVALAAVSRAADADSLEVGDVWQDVHALKVFTDRRIVQGKAAR